MLGLGSSVACSSWSSAWLSILTRVLERWVGVGERELMRLAPRRVERGDEGDPHNFTESVSALAVRVE